MYVYILNKNKFFSKKKNFFFFFWSFKKLLQITIDYRKEKKKVKNYLQVAIYKFS